MQIQKMRDVLTAVAYWALIALAVYVAFKYLLPVSVPFILGALAALPVVKLSRLLRCNHKVLRSFLTLLLYGLLGTVVTLLGIKGVDLVTELIQWIASLYDTKLLPMVNMARMSREKRRDSMVVTQWLKGMVSFS